MKKRNLVLSLTMAALLMLSGCAGQNFEPVIFTVKSEAPEENSAEETDAAETVGNTEETVTPKSSEESKNDPEKEKETLQSSAAQSSETAEYVGIDAHVKEIHEDSILISSDTDDFPGAFTVIGIQDAAGADELKGGIPIQILMENLNEKDKEGLPVYRAKRIVAVPEEKALPQPDIILTDAPEFSLNDALSSTYSPLKIQSGSYSWTVEENGEGKSVIACGISPLDAARLNADAKVKLPRYQKMDSVIYTFSTEVAPDILIVRQWDMSDVETDTEDADVKERSVTTFYYKNPFLELEPGKVYEFTAEWKEEKLSQNRFCGTASYVLVTE